MFKVRHDCIGRVLFVQDNDDDDDVDDNDRLFERERKGQRKRERERERETNEEERAGKREEGDLPRKTQTIDFCGFFSLHSVYQQKEKERRNTTNPKKRRTWKLRPHLIHAEEEEGVEEDAEEETLVATRLAKCLSMVFFSFAGKNFSRRKTLCVFHLGFCLFFKLFVFSFFSFPRPLHKIFVLVKKVRAVLCVF